MARRHNTAMKNSLKYKKPPRLQVLDFYSDFFPASTKLRAGTD